MAKEKLVEEAVEIAKDFIQAAISPPIEVGHGQLIIGLMGKKRNEQKHISSTGIVFYCRDARYGRTVLTRFMQRHQKKMLNHLLGWNH